MQYTIVNLITSFSIFIATLLCGKLGMPLLHKLQVGQVVREDGPKSHYVKSGTPTFGGLFFFIPLALSALILPLVDSHFISYSLVFAPALLFAVVGFLDDFIKIRLDQGGLSVKQKIIYLGFTSLLFAVWYLWFAPFDPTIYLPFGIGHVGITGGFKFLYLIFICLFLFFTANTVNITDGVDGLAASLAGNNGIFLALSLFILVKKAELGQAHEPLITASLATAAGCLAFLYFNHHPAKVFMGDTGSQGLGAVLGIIVILTGVPWLFFISCLVFVLDGLSTLLQVWYFRHTGGKRIFRMAPIHHHFELGGWTEWQIVRRFNYLAVVAGLLGLLVVAC